MRWSGIPMFSPRKTYKLFRRPVSIILRLTVSRTEHICNERIFARFIEMNRPYGQQCLAKTLIDDNSL